MKQNSTKKKQNLSASNSKRKSHLSSLRNQNTQGSKISNSILRLPDSNHEKHVPPSNNVQNEMVDDQMKIFEGLTFFLETFEDNYSISDIITPQITSQGGEIVKQLTKDTSYYVFNNGRTRTLQKAALNQEFNDVKIVSPQWVQQCQYEGKVVDHGNFKPLDYEQRLLEEQNQQSSGKKINDKKRQSSIQNENEKILSPIKSKRRIKASGKKHTHKSKVQEQSQMLLDEEPLDHNPLFDREELDKTIQQIQEEKFFLKEFAKDLKKFTKQQDIMNADEAKSRDASGIEQKKQKKESRHMNKNQLIDSYIEGDIELADFIQHMGNKMKDKKNGKSKQNQAQGMKRLSEMFQVGSKKNKLVNQHEDDESHKMNKTTIVTLQDFLYDIDKENSPLNDQHKNISQKQIGQSTRQTNLSFGKVAEVQRPLFNYKPQNFFLNKALLSGDDNSAIHQRITKSSTFNPPLQNNSEPIMDESFEDSLPKAKTNYLFPFNISARRTQSLNPSKSYQTTSQNPKVSNTSSPVRFQELQQNTHKTLNGKQFSKSGVKESKYQNHKKKKEWEKILPQRKVPSRICKMNVSYVEKDEDYLEKMINKKRIQFLDY